MVYKFEAVCVLSEVRAEAEKLLSIDHVIEKSIIRWQYSGRRNQRLTCSTNDMGLD